MSDSKTVTNVTVPIGGLLGIAFVVLKLCSVIDWSWWWVTCPFWAPLAIGLTIAVVAGLVALLFFGIAGFIGYWSNQRVPK